MRLPALATLLASALLSAACADVGGLAPAAMDAPGSPIMHADVASSTPAPAVSNLVVSTGRPYSVSNTGLGVGSSLYVDGSYTVKAPLPAALEGLTHVRTANADREVRSKGALFSLTMTGPATVYVAHDDRNSRPAWLKSGYKDTGLDIVSTNGGRKFSVFQRSVQAGEVSFGDNIDKGRRAGDMYFVIVKPQEATQPAPPSLPAPEPAPEPAPDLPPPADSTPIALASAISSAGSGYAVVPALAAGESLYVDREYTAMEPLPASLQGLQFIRTANDDKDLIPPGGTLMSFDLSAPAIVRVAHDDRIERPQWLTSGFTDSGLDLISTDGAKKFSVFQKSVPAGRVSLGPNVKAPAGESMYIVILQRQDSAVTLPLPEPSPAPEPQPEPEPPAPAPVASVSVTPGTVALEIGENRQLTAVTRDADGSVLDGRVVSWSSSRPDLVTVTSAGRVTAVAAGTAIVTGASEGRSASAIVTVNAPASGSDPEDPHAGYYVSPAGSSGGDGSVGRPWDLASALGRSLRGGDTLWLRGGTYRGAFTSTLSGTSTAPVVVRQYPGERATLDGQLVVRGSYSTFWGFELMSSVTAPGNVAGLNVFGPGTRIINLVVHDHGGNGIGTWAEGPNTEIYGNLVYNNGRQRVVPNFAHGIYGQNSAGTKWVRENIVFNQFGYGLHFYAEGGALQGIQLEGNVVFQNGTPASSRGEPNLELGGASPATGARVVGNLIYKSSTEGTNAWVGYNEGTQNQDLVLRDNYIVGGSPALRLRKWTQVTASGNTFVGPAELVNVLGSRSGFSWSGNRHYRTPSARAWTVDNAAYTFADWVNRAGIGSSDAVSASPSGTYVVVQPNKYERGRAHVTVFNWSGQGSVAADLSQALTPGQRYEVRNAQDYFGNPVASGTYGGGSITLTLTAVAPPRPIGGSIATLASTGTKFNSFVVVPLP